MADNDLPQAAKAASDILAWPKTGVQALADTLSAPSGPGASGLPPGIGETPAGTVKYDKNGGVPTVLKPAPAQNTPTGLTTIKNFGE